jgi:tRNA(Ile)-lysidine synthase
VRLQVLRNIRELALMRAGDRVCVAVSGGADSVALLRVLLELRVELGMVLAVAHFNHQLRGDDSEADEAFVANLAREHRLEFFAGRADVRQHALAHKLSVEAAGRELRYEWFGSVAAKQRFDSLATAHTLDDQAETVLLKFLRGAGTRGLAGIYPELFLDAQKKIRIVRPLLRVTRNAVETYLSALGQSWREDESNLDHRFARNRLRHELLPLLEREYNPNFRQVLSDTSELSRAEEEYWRTVVESELKVRAQAQRLSLCGLEAMPLALQRRVLRAFAESEDLALDFEHVESLLHCAVGGVPKVELPGRRIASRRGDSLFLEMPNCEQPRVGYQYTLSVPGEVRLTDLGCTVRAMFVPESSAAESGETDNLLSADLLGGELTVRNWRPGDRFWPAHTGSEEKLKRLFAEKRIPAEQRPSWPVALCGEQIVWVRGFPVARAFAWNGKRDAVRIESLGQT